jgi:glycosyltransferase involved in cell wall biosynthesis
MLSPLPAGPDHPPESGVAEYTASLVRCLDTPITVLAQKQAASTSLGLAMVARVWKPNLGLPLQVKGALAGIKPEIVHVQHEFNLYGGLLQGTLLTVLLKWIRSRGTRTVTTVHGVVAPEDVTPPFLVRNGLPRYANAVRSAFRLSYRAIDASSDLLVVHHEHFRDVLVHAYGVRAEKVIIIPHGADDNPSYAQASPKQPGKNVLCLGFLTGYKLPELVVEVAESGAIPDATFTFCVGINPRLRNRLYLDRAAALERRVHALGPRAAWNGYVPDDALGATLQSADVLVLPYTECVSVSGISALARQWRLPVCYSQPLQHLFGPGPLEFELDSRALAAAIVRAFAGEANSSKSGFVPWQEAARATQAAWVQLLASR